MNDKFEYKRVPTEEISTELMNEYGEDGWEFVEEDREGYYVFKRKMSLNEHKQILHG